MSDNNRGPEVPQMMYDRYVEKEVERNESRKQQRELYLANKERLEKQKELRLEKKKLFVKNVKRTVVATSLVAVGGLSFFANQQIKGSERIANQFYKYTVGYGINNQSNGYIAIADSKVISLDSAFYDMVNDARYDGMTDSEIYIGISKIYNSDFARKYVGSISLEERMLANLNAYGKDLAEEYGVELNDGKTSGGILR